MVRLLILLFVIAIFHPKVASAIEHWKFFNPNITIEKSVIAVFGPPDVVSIQYSYENFQRAKGSGDKVEFPAYELSYNRFRGDLSILKGPLGEAASIEVQIENGIVTAVDWNYSAKYKPTAEALWKKDKGFETSAGKAVTIGSKKLPAGNALFVTCTTGANGKCDGPIQVMYSKDIETMTERNRSVSRKR